jgi:putative DNA primase/helicase
MSAPQELLNTHGIELKSYAPGQHYATCPRCSAKRRKEHQKNECLGVLIEPGDKVCWHCNHCDWSGPEKGSGGGNKTELPAYIYRDRDGVVRFRKVRNRPGKEPRFWLEQPDGKGWKKGTKGVDTTILYRADEVRRAIEAGREIAVAEGEKDCDNLWRIGIPATCNAHGASEIGKKPKWAAAHSAQLESADLVVFNDNDAPGYAHADTICKLSAGVAKRVRRLDLATQWPEIPKGGDVSDWLAAGGEHTPERLRELIESAPAIAEPEKSDPTPPDDDAEIERLAKLSAFEYERSRSAAADELKVRTSILDKLVAAKRAELGLGADDGKQGHAIELAEPEPWPDSVDGAALLNALSSAIGKHVVMAKHARHLAALWVVHSYLLDAFLITPRLAIRSPTRRCGKTTLLDVLARLVNRPLPAANVSAAAVFRVIEGHRPCLLIDEADTFLHDNEELRGVLNSGHRRGGSVLRTVGDDHEPRSFATYAACVIALIGQLPGTLTDRSVAIDLKRRLPSESIEPFRLDRTEHLDVLARQAARWAQDHVESVRAADPAMPDGIYNRDADNLRPLLAIADVAAGRWPKRARNAALAGREADDVDEGSRIELLIRDIHDIFAATDRLDKISSDILVDRLIAIDGHPWAEYGRSAKPITKNKLARLLKPLKIAPEQIRFTAVDSRKGYWLHQFKEAFDRYLPPEGGLEPKQRNKRDETGTSEHFQTETTADDVSDRKCEKSNNDGQSFDVSDGKGGNGREMHDDDLDIPGFLRRESPTSAEAGLFDTADGIARRPRSGCYEVIGPEPPGTACAHCTLAYGQVYLMRNPFQGVACEALHEACANAWFVAQRAADA